MRLLKLFLATLLCIAIPLQGIAGMAVTKTPCPAESAGMMAVADSADEHGCCNDADTVAKTGKPCKAEQDCQPASPGMLDQTENRQAVSIGTTMNSFTNRSAPAFEPSAAWRPPTQA